MFDFLYPAESGTINVRSFREMHSADHDPQPPHTRSQSGTNADQASALAELGAMAPLYAHEMNNLMTHLSGRAQLAMLHQDQPELAHQALQAVVEGCKQAAQLAELFLATGIAANECDAEPDFSSLVDQVIAQMPDHDQLPTIILDDQSTVHDLKVPSLVIGQLLNNLIRNAHRAIREHPTPNAPTHKITIQLSQPHASCSTWNMADADHQLQLVVEDTGVGMSDSQIAAVLRGPARITQHIPTTTNHPRHGLGLRVCATLIKQVGGTLRCESAPNEGTRMIIRLPATKSGSDSHKRAA